MPFWIQGWIEVTSDQPDSAEAIWQGAVDLSVLIDTTDRVSEKLFGLSKSYRSDHFLRQSSLFADRGLPPVRSAAVEREWQSHLDLGEQHGRDRIGIGGYTFASLAEVRAEMPSELSLERSDWQLAFTMAEILVTSGRHSADQVRFVVWCNW